jgi:hypothetical protein
LKCDLKKSTLDCLVEQTLDATTLVDFVPHGVDLRCKKQKALSGKTKRNEKSEKTSSFVIGAGLRLRPKSACATGVGLRLRPKSSCAIGVGLGATVSTDLCHQSGLEYLSQGFQTQGTVTVTTRPGKYRTIA